MEWFRRFCQLLKYAALLPTVSVLLAAGVILAGGEGAAPLTMLALPQCELDRAIRAQDRAATRAERGLATFSGNGVTALAMPRPCLVPHLHELAQQIGPRT
jgi:hypothetical protein